MSETFINLQHCRALGICNHGLRAFCKIHSLDLRDFRDGLMTVNKMKATGDDFWSTKLEAVALANPIGGNE